MNMPAREINEFPTLRDLLQGYADAPDLPVSGIASDSRLVGEGDVFFACQGERSHGLDYLDEVRAAGAAAVVWDSSTATAPTDAGLPTIGVADLGAKLGTIADRFYGSPSAALNVYGVTGTNGKTTVAWLLAQCGELLGEPCGYIGTLGHGLGEVVGAEGMTTPAALELHGQLAEFVAGHARHAALEVSSHALSQGRVDGVRFDAALFTNLTRDHLDYHASMRDYFESKARLFTDYAPRNRIINLDSEYGLQLAERCGQDVVTVSTNFDRVANGRPYVFVRSVVATGQGSDVTFTSAWGDGRFMLALPGDFNVANAALVLALLLRKGVDLETACECMSLLQAPPGRMERVPGNGPVVYVDYAHTPNALEVALRALRAHVRGKLWCVFGCGGDRDAGKRPQMGRIAERMSDRVVLTSDNPRSEDPQAIIDDILGGFARPETATVIEDRAAAIAWTIEQAGAGDIILIAGKGHEGYQQIGDERRVFSDRAVAQSVLAAREGSQ
jgi:UDP-N-acetylmuramoyl-L-alanyl-D-glutamate--2,6-diaminopimelate ligase